MKETGMPANRMTRKAITLAVLTLGAVLVTQCKAQVPQNGQWQRSPTPSPILGKVGAETVVQGLEHPWALAFLPDGRLLVTERPGRLRIVDRQGRLSQPLGGVPRVQAQGQGGLLDVAIDPEFEKSRLVYISFSEPGEGGAGTAVARGRLGEGGLEDVTVIYRQQPKVQGSGHFGSRLVFATDGKLFVTQGDRQAYREFVTTSGVVRSKSAAYRAASPTLSVSTVSVLSNVERVAAWRFHTPPIGPATCVEPMRWSWLARQRLPSIRNSTVPSRGAVPGA
jgi:glucose/arabinose dehydrogenase